MSGVGETATSLLTHVGRPCRAFDMPHYMLVFAAFASRPVLVGKALQLLSRLQITGYHAWSSDSPLQDRLQLLRHAFERTGLVVSNKEQSLLVRPLDSSPGILRS